MTTPSIQTQAVLVSLSFGMPRQSRQLKTEAKKIEEDNHAQAGVAKASIFYWKQKIKAQEVNGLDALQKFFNAWRSEHNRLTRVWDGNNTRLLPAKLAEQYYDMTETKKTLVHEVVAKFLEEEYPQWQSSAPVRMGDLYSQEDFPSLKECQERITWETIVTPLPEAAQIKKVALINPEMFQLFENTTNERVAKARAEILKETWVDLIDPLKKIVETLSKDKPKIYDTLLGRLHDIVDLVPAFNLDNDPELSTFAADCKAQLGGITADDLRNNEGLKKTTLQSAQGLLATFGTLGARRFVQD